MKSIIKTNLSLKETSKGHIDRKICLLIDFDGTLNKSNSLYEHENQLAIDGTSPASVVSTGTLNDALLERLKDIQGHYLKQNIPISMGICTARIFKGTLLHVYKAALLMENYTRKPDGSLYTIEDELIFPKLAILKKRSISLEFVNTRMDVTEFQHNNDVYTRYIEPFERGLLAYLANYKFVDKPKGISHQLYALRRLLVLFSAVHDGIVDVTTLPTNLIYLDLGKFLQRVESSLPNGESLSLYMTYENKKNLFTVNSQCFMDALHCPDFFVFGKCFRHIILNSKSKVPQIQSILPARSIGILIDDNHSVLRATKRDAGSNIMCLEVSELIAMKAEEPLKKIDKLYQHVITNNDIKSQLTGGIKNSKDAPSVAVIGGGVAGATAAIRLAEIGCQVTLLEKNNSLINGPPTCHLHAGGNLYREIPLDHCEKLLEECIEFARFYPQAIDSRPTVICVPNRDEGTPDDLLPKLTFLQKKYRDMVKQDPKNKVLGEPDDYYRSYSLEDLLKLAKKNMPSKISNMDDWMIPFAKNVDLTKIKMPVYLVKEFGLNCTRLAALSMLSLEKKESCRVLTETNVVHVKKENGKWAINYEQKKDNARHTIKVDYLINAAGFRTGLVDDMLALHVDRMVEFKAAYVIDWQDRDKGFWPEIIFHGKRGSPEGMLQFTPYPNGKVQVHCMSEDSTLFSDGMAQSTLTSSQPVLPNKFIRKINKGWQPSEVEHRTQMAIQRMSDFIPSIVTADIVHTPLFGAQQIPSKDPTLRAGSASFGEGNITHYARCEVVKASSSLRAADEIAQHMIESSLLNENALISSQKHTPLSDSPTLIQINNMARKLATERGLPTALAQRIVPTG